MYQGAYSRLTPAIGREKLTDLEPLNLVTHDTRYRSGKRTLGAVAPSRSVRRMELDPDSWGNVNETSGRLSNFAFDGEAYVIANLRSSNDAPPESGRHFLPRHSLAARSTKQRSEVRIPQSLIKRWEIVLQNLLKVRVNDGQFSLIRPQ